MVKTTNPFIVTGKIEPEYFCDRVTESVPLVKSVTKDSNIVNFIQKYLINMI